MTSYLTLTPRMVVNFLNRRAEARREKLPSASPSDQRQLLQEIHQLKQASKVLEAEK